MLLGLSLLKQKEACIVVYSHLYLNVNTGQDNAIQYKSMQICALVRYQPTILMVLRAFYNQLLATAKQCEFTTRASDRFAASGSQFFRKFDTDTRHSHFVVSYSEAALTFTNPMGPTTLPAFPNRYLIVSFRSHSGANDNDLIALVIVFAHVCCFALSAKY
jgi:hypothetical protein